MNSIEKLRSVCADERPKILTDLYERNRAFFRETYPIVDTFIENVNCPYHFNITDDFLEIVHSPSNTLAHPDTGLDVFSEALANTSHKAWEDFVNLQPDTIKDSPLHNVIIDDFRMNMRHRFPVILGELDNEKISIALSGAGEKVLPPVVFAGIFHGLHIDLLLRDFAINRILLIEPEPERFEVSCYFMDYERIYQQYGSLPLNIGKKILGSSLHAFHSADKVTSRVWIRVLPGYDSPAIQNVFSQLLMQQHLLDGQTTSYDREMTSMMSAERNIQAGLPILSKRPNLSDEAHIAVIAAGPSLQNDFAWLRDNQEKLIIFAVHSAVKPLRSNGIRVDFQVSVDTYLNQVQLEQLDLDHDIPLLSYYKASRETMEWCKQPLLLVEKNVANVANFHFALEDTHPSSTNLAVSFALFCKPAKISLCGVDVGFRDKARSFIKGGRHEDIRLSAEGHLFNDIPNFNETGDMYTTTFFNLVKQRLEKKFQGCEDKVEVFNLSDGVFIQGATPMRSSQMHLQEYSGKGKDIAMIIRCFKPMRDNKSVERYNVSGTTVLEVFREQFVQHLSLKRYDWSTLCKRIDSVMLSTVKRCREISNCLRPVVYERLAIDLLTQWYTYMLLCPDKKNAESMYVEGREEISKALDKVEWPVL